MMLANSPDHGPMILATDTRRHACGSTREGIAEEVNQDLVIGARRVRRVGGAYPCSGTERIAARAWAVRVAFTGLARPWHALAPGITFSFSFSFSFSFAAIVVRVRTGPERPGRQGKRCHCDK